MKITKGKVILIVVIILLSISAVKNINKEKDNNQILLNDVTIVKNGIVDSSNEGKLVLVTGKISYDGKIKFDELDEEIDSFKVIRTVEDYGIIKTDDDGNKHYGWVERTESYKSDDYLHGLISETKTLETKIGNFTLDQYGLDQIATSSMYKEQEKIEKLEFDGIYYSLLDHKENPKVGDMRISYNYYDIKNAEYISILACQKGDSFELYKLDKDTNVYNIYYDKIDTKDKLKKELGSTTKTNLKLKIIFIIMVVGIGIFFIVDAKKKK